MTLRDWPIRVRLARREDKDAVLSFATNTWNGGDYIPHVWDEWVVPSSGVLLVATVDPSLHGEVPRDAEGRALVVGQPIAMVRVVMLSEHDAWLEGIRVDPRVRGMGVATDLQVSELRWIAAHGARAVRYMTATDNIGSQRLGARHGLLEVGRWRAYGGGSLPNSAADGDPSRIAAKLSALGKAGNGAWSRVRDDPTFRRGHSLYECRSWAFQELTEERFRQHVARDEVVIATRGGAWAVLLVNRLGIGGRQLHIALAAGDGEALLDPLVTLGRPELRIPYPDAPLLGGVVERFAAEGYTPGLQTSIVVERQMDPAHPLPDADDPRLLVLGDEPRRICVPPALA